MKHITRLPILTLLTLSFILAINAIFHQGVQAQDSAKSQILELATNAISTLASKPGYAPYMVNSVHVNNTWAWVDFHSLPIESQQSEDIQQAGIMPIVKFGIARYNAASGWTLYLQNDARYPARLNNSPDSMRWLKQVYVPSVDVKNKIAPTINLSNLPYATGAAWRYIYGPAADHFPTHALDFGVLPRNQSGNVYAMDDGVIVLKGNACLIIQHNNVRAMVQHIDHTGLDLDVGKSVYRGQLLGKTTTSPGCSGFTSTHHVHIHFQDPADDSIVNLIGNATINGWKVEGTFGATTLTKGNISINAAENPGLIPHANMTCQEGTQSTSPPSFVLYGGDHCQSIRLTGFVTDNQPIFQQDISESVHGIFIPYGYRAILTHNDAYQACFDASVDQLKKFYYAGTPIPIGGDDVMRIKFRKIQDFNDGCEAPYPASDPTCPGDSTFCGSTVLPPDYDFTYLPLIGR